MKGKIYWGGSFILLLLILVYFVNFTPRARIARRNMENAKMLKVGIPIKEVFKIMGSPFSIHKVMEDSLYRDRSIRLYNYMNYWGGDSDIMVVADSSHGVIWVYAENFPLDNGHSIYNHETDYLRVSNEDTIKH